MSTKSTAARRPMRRGIVASVCAWSLLGIAGGRAGCAAEAAAAAPSQGNSIAIRNFMFAPMSLQVTLGTTVTWTNFDAEPHVIRSVDDAFRSGALDQNESFSFRFDKAGTYKYICSIHPQMLATIVVK